MTTARELLKCGYQNISIFEATDRIAGRAYTVMPDVKPGHEGSAKQGITPFELGAMRIPFFTPEDPTYAKNGNSVMDYFIRAYNQQFQDFPDPGADFLTTGVWINGGFGPSPDADNFMGIIKWVGGEAIPNDELQAISIAWDKWSKAVIEKCRTMYLQGDVNDWYAFWEKVLQTYWTKNFRDVALAPFTPEHAAEGNFGGLGLTVQQSSIFYTIGAGDGSWGAFFDIGALYPMRTLLLGLPQPTNCWVILTRTVCLKFPPNSQTVREILSKTLYLRVSLPFPKCICLPLSTVIIPTLTASPCTTAFTWKIAQ